MEVKSEKVRGGALEVCGPPLLMVAKCFLGLLHSIRSQCETTCWLCCRPGSSPWAGARMTWRRPNGMLHYTHNL